MQGVPLAREVDYLITVLWRTLVAELLCKGQTGQQLLLGAYSAMNRQVVERLNRTPVKCKIW
jgi:hypothetical protein